MSGERLLQKGLIFLTSVIVFIYAFEGIWGTVNPVPYILTGALAVVIAGYALVFGRLYRNIDTLLWAVFLSLAWISTIVNLGVSIDFFLSKFLCTWMMFLALYYVVQIINDPKELLKQTFGVYSAGLCLLCLYVLANATASLNYEIPLHDKVNGCFLSGRICALYNANIFAFTCVTLIVSSVFAYLSFCKRIRLLFVFTGIVGWFCLGLTGCRTGMIGVSLAMGLTVFSEFHAGKLRLGTKSALLKNILPVLISFLTFLFLLESFMLPVHLYRLVLTVAANLMGQSDILTNVSSLVIRRISDDDGTFSDRTLIWPRGIAQCLKNPRRFLLGISPLSKEVVSGIYEGHHEITAPHAHNTYIDLLRKHGVLGFITWMSLLVMWAGIGIRILFDKEESSQIRCLMASIAGILVMGLVESVPFSYTAWCYTAIPFFLACGYCYRNRSKVR